MRLGRVWGVCNRRQGEGDPAPGYYPSEVQVRGEGLEIIGRN